MTYSLDQRFRCLSLLFVKFVAKGKETMRLLARVYRPEEAEMIAEVFRNNGIATTIQGENFSALYPVYPTGVSEIRILVEDHQFDAAADLLQAYFGKTPIESP